MSYPQDNPDANALLRQQLAAAVERENTANALCEAATDDADDAKDAYGIAVDTRLRAQNAMFDAPICSPPDIEAKIKIMLDRAKTFGAPDMAATIEQFATQMMAYASQAMAA